MELPEDVLPLVRAFAKPHMKFYREFKQGLADLGFANEDWPAVRQKLCSSDAEQVLQAFQDYVRICITTNNMNAEYKQSGRPPHLIYALSKQMAECDRADRAFRILLVGEAAMLQYDAECDDLYA